MNERLLKYLRSIGLDHNATEQEAEQYLQSLEWNQAEYALELMQQEEDEEQAEDEEEQKQEEDEEDEEESSEQSEQSRRAAYKRLNEINALATKFNLDQKWVEKMNMSEKSIQQVRDDVLKKLEKRAKPVATKEGPTGMNGNTSGITVGRDRNRDTISMAIEDALFQRAGVAIPKQIGDSDMLDFEMSSDRFDNKGNRVHRHAIATRDPHERSREFRGRRLHEMARMFLEAHGVDTRGMGSTAVSKMVFNRKKMMDIGISNALQSGGAHHTTSDFPSILENIATKTLRMAYLEAPRTWPIWCRRTTAPDFKEVSRTQLGEMPTLRVVPEGAEIKHVTVADSKQPMTLATYGEIFTLAWQVLINDDLDAFMRLPQMRGSAAARVEEDLVYNGVLNSNVLSDGTTLFSIGNGNNIASGGAPSVDELNTVYALMASQTGLHDDAILDIEPAVMIAPVALRGTALELLTTQAKPGTGDPGGVGNIWQGQLDLVTTARLDSNDEEAWYAAASPNSIDTVEVMFLEEEQQPVLEEEDAFDTFGRRYRVRHSVAAGAIDHRGLVRNTGS